MHTTTLIAHALRSMGVAPATPNTEQATCCLTGETTLCIARKELLGPSFTDTHLLRAPASQFIGADVYIAWRYGHRAEGKRRDMRPEANQCWLATQKEFSIVRKPEIRECVLNGCASKPWALWVTTSYKKHGSLRAPVNSRRRGCVGFDELVVDCRDQVLVWQIWEQLNQALETGIGRTVIESLNCPPHIMQKVGIVKWLEFESWAKPLFQGGLYQLLTYLLPSQEERNAVQTTREE